MRSVKPGRGPSMLEGVMSIAVGIFGIVWTILAASFGAGFMAIFGIVFVFVAIAQGLYHFKNATSKDRYSQYDIVDEWEEKDPLNARYGGSHALGEQRGQGLLEESMDSSFSSEGKFCPYCGTRVEKDYVFCSKCGKKLP